MFQIHSLEVPSYTIHDAINDLDSLTSDEHAKAARALRQMYHEPKSSSDDEVIARHKERLRLLIN